MKNLKCGTDIFALYSMIFFYFLSFMSNAICLTFKLFYQVLKE